MVAKGNPQWPQAFYSMPHAFEVDTGDKLTARYYSAIIIPIFSIFRNF